MVEPHKGRFGQKGSNMVVHLPQGTWKHYARVSTLSLLDRKLDKGQAPPIVYP